jgi:hypothetical protein
MRSSDSGVRGHCFGAFFSPGRGDDESVVPGKAEKAATALPLRATGDITSVIGGFDSELSPENEADYPE